MEQPWKLIEVKLVLGQVNSRHFRSQILVDMLGKLLWQVANRQVEAVLEWVSF